MINRFFFLVLASLTALGTTTASTAAQDPADAKASCNGITPSTCANRDTLPADSTIWPTAAPTAGPLSRVGRYFVDATGSVAYLTGSHTWNNFQDWGDCRDDFDFDAYLDMLASCGHNFIRLWAWEAPSIGSDSLYDPDLRPMPWNRTGSLFDLSGNPVTVNPSYLSRLQNRVAAARARGIYVSVMLFQGWSVQQKVSGLNPWPSHPFEDGNNNVGIDADVSSPFGRGEELHHLPLDPAIDRRQKDYVTAVVQALQGYDNVLWEISNESDAGSDAWQDAMVSFVRGLDPVHPIGRTSYGAGTSNQDLFASGADWISPAASGGQDYEDDPPADNQGKVVISDTDHLPPILQGDGGVHFTWIWKNFTRGLHSIVMDPVSHRFSQAFATETNPLDAKWRPIRRSLGQAQRFARRLDLSHAEPRDATTCSQYCLAIGPGVPSRQYLIYSPPKEDNPIRLRLDSGLYQGEWLNAATSATQPVTLNGNGSFLTLNKPYSNAVLFLERVGAPLAPTNVRASDFAFRDRVRVSWNAAAGATGYQVFRRTIDNPSGASMIGSVAGTSFDDTSAQEDVVYHYWIKASNSSGVSGFSASDSGYSAPRASVVADGFANVAPSRDPGDPLHGTTAELGGRVWTATTATGFGVDQITNRTTSSAHVGGIAFSPAAFAQSLVTVEAKADPETGWIGVGFSRSATGLYWNDAQLWMYLRPSGRLVVAANGTRHTLYNPGGVAPGFVADGLNRLRLEYDRGQNSVRAWLNGSALALSISDLDRFGFVPDILYAGFHGQSAGNFSAPGVLSIDDFAISVSGPPAPVTRIFTPIADAHTTQNWPTRNYGFEDHLRLRFTSSGLGRYVYLKFNVTGVNGTVLSTRLKVRTQGTEIPSVGFYRVATTSWTEGGITWANQPLDYGYIRSEPRLAPNLWHTIDITRLSNGAPLFAGNGVVSLGIASGGDLPNLDLWSRESSFAPVLEVTYQP